MVVGQVKELGEVLGGKGTKVFEVQDCEAIRPGGPRVASVPDSLGDEMRCERGGGCDKRAL